MFKVRSGKLAITVFTLVAVMVSATSAQTVWYVDDSSTGGLNDGSDWDNAFVELQAALAVAVDGDEIRVAQGIYTPDYNVATGSHTGDRSLSFDLTNGVSIFGGYAGFGAGDPGLRNLVNHISVLSGDLAGDDEPGFVNNGENSYHVVTAELLGSDSKLDGFVITGGNARYSDGGGIVNLDSSLKVINCEIRENLAGYGGGVHNQNGSPTFENCIIEGNWAEGINAHGGGMNNEGSDPTLTNCEFRSNIVNATNRSRGGGMCNAGSSPRLVNCVFEGNSAQYENSVDGYHCYGGGMWSYFGDSSPTLINCTFQGNSAYHGGGVYSDYGCSLTFINCSFTRNSARGGGGVTNNNNNSTFSNCLLWGNIDGGGFDESAQINNRSGSTPSVSHCCIQGLDTYAGNNNIGDDPLLLRGSCHLRDGSPCIDQGNPVWDYAGLVDNDGEQRQVGERVDIGADEFLDTDTDSLPDWWEDRCFGSPTIALPGDDQDGDGENNLAEFLAGRNPLQGPKTYYVSLAGNDGWDGLAAEWDGEHGPKATIQAGIDIAQCYEGDTIIVLPGTYTGEGNRDLDYDGKAMAIRSTESADSLDTGPTIIDCEGSEEEPHRGFIFRNFEESDSVLSGLKIRGGYAKYGGGVQCRFSSPSLFNCLLKGNSAERGGGLSIEYVCNPNIINCVLTLNSAVSAGGGVYNRSYSSPVLINCLLDRNSAGEEGGGIYNNNSDPILTNCVLWGNADGDGLNEAAQIRDVSESDPYVAYCCIQGLDTYTGNGNIGDNPLFTDDRLHLQSTSPCIDQGDPNGTYVDRVDIDGETRIEGGRADIGPDEFWDSDVDGLPDWWEEYYFSSSTAALPEGNPDGDDQNNLAEYGASTDPNTNPTTYYVSVTGDDSWDGLSSAWDGVHGPLATIQSGIDVADPRKGDEVVLLPGTYVGDGNRDLDFLGKSIIVRGSNPTDSFMVARTIIDCGGSQEEPHRAFIFHSSEDSGSVVSGITISGGYAVNGGAVHCTFSSPQFVHCVFRSNSAKSGGGMYNYHNSSPTLVNCAFFNNSASNYGGGIYNSGSSNSGLYNCILSGNYGYRGGGICNNDLSCPRLNNSILWANASSTGSVESTQVYNYDASSSPILTYCCVQGLDTYSGNGNFGEDPLLAGDSLHLQSGSPCIGQGDPNESYSVQADIDGESRLIGTIIDVGPDEFSDVDADGLPDWWEEYYFGSYDVALPDGDPDNDGRDNLAEYVASTNPTEDATVYYVSLSGNDSWDGLASEWDGEHGPKLTIQAGIDAANRFDGDTVIVLPGTYVGKGNRDLDYVGKSITVRSTNPQDSRVVAQTVIDCQSDEEEPHRGFLFHSSEGTDSVLNGLTIRGGYAEYGGGVDCLFSNPTVKNCLFIENQAVSGGGFACRLDSNPEFGNCVFKDNLVKGDFSKGGGVYIDSGSPTFKNCVFKKNMAEKQGGGLYGRGGCNPTLRNCSFLGNTADSGGGAFNYSSYLTLVNCIFWRNNDSGGFDESAQILNHYDTISIENCCIQGLDNYMGNGNVSDDPKVTRDGIHLLSGSPVIDMGDPDGEYSGLKDIDGEERIHGVRVDIGADEFLDSDLDELPDWWEMLYFGSATNASPDDDQDFDGRDNLTEYVENTNPFNRAAVYYVSPAGNDTWDGLAHEWDGEHGPKATIQAGIDLAHPYEGDIVSVLPGVYKGEGNRDLDYGGKAITVRSVNPTDPDTVAQTIIDCEGTRQEPHRAFHFHNQENSSSRLSGLTIRGSYGSSGGAVLCRLSSPTISNCRFAENEPAGVANHDYSNPSISNCEFSNNSESGLTNVDYCSPVLVNCVFIGNTGNGMSNNSYCDPTVSNCVFKQNFGGGIDNTGNCDPEIINCNIVQNSGYGICNSYDSNPSISNCILWQNSGNNGFQESSQVYDHNSTSTLSFCCVQYLEGNAGNGNIGDDPRLTRDRMHLQSDSPCIDQGDYTGDYLGEVDIDGEPRIAGGRIDIGVDEFADTDDDQLPDWWEKLYFASTTAANPGDNPDNDDRENLLEYSNSSDPQVIPVTYYVSQAGDDSWDGLAVQWDGEHGPLATIRKGTDTCHPFEGDTVVICPGVYTGDGNRDIDYRGKAVTLQSTDPENPDVVAQTVIDCEGGESDSHNGFTLKRYESSDSVLNGVTIRNGFAQYGGAVYISDGSPTLKNCVFENNSAYRAYSGPFASIYGEGGGVYAKNSSVILEDCVFIDNYAYKYGGGLQCINGEPSITGCTFTGNRTQYGGGMHNEECSSAITSCIFEANSATGWGGGVCNRENSSPTLFDCTMKYNEADESGGGIFNENQSNSKLLNCRIINNTVVYDWYGLGGGGMCNVESAPVMTNTVFSNNYAHSRGGGICNQYSDPVLYNCTLANNEAFQGGGGIYTESGNPAITSSVLWGNIAGADSVEFEQAEGGNNTLSYCCVQGLDVYSGNGNIGDDPLFVDTNGLDGIPGTEDDDLRLRAGSPCINAGDNSLVPVSVSADLDGLPRVHACIVDMGAYEYQGNHYFGDADENCVVDLADYLDFSFCLDRFGYERNPILDACIEVFDADGDKDVDLADFAEFQRVFAGG